MVSDCDGCILFLDSDDLLMPNAMSTLAPIMETSGADIVVFSFNQVGLPFDPPYNEPLDQAYIRKTILPQHLNILPHSAGFLQPFVWNKCCRYAFIRKYSFRFDEWRRTWEDNAFVIRCLDKCSKLIIIPDKLYQTAGSDTPSEHLSKRIDTELFSSYILGYEKNVEQFGNEYDFKNEHTARHFFDVINRTLVSFYPECEERSFNELLRMLLDNKTMNDWVDGITPRNDSERNIVSAFQNNDAALLAQIYKSLAEKQSMPVSEVVSLKAKLKRAARKLFGDGLIEKIKGSRS